METHGVFAQLSTQELLQKLEELGDRAPAELIQAILSRGQEVVLPLSKILQERRYWEASDDTRWMPVNAVKMLGIIADPQALPQLINTLVLVDEMDNDWIIEDLPTVFGHIGPPAIEPLIEFIQAHRGDSEFQWPRIDAANGLVAIVIHHQRERERVLPFLHELFSEGEDLEFLGFVAIYLLDLNDPSCFPVLEEAFNKGLIDEEFGRIEDSQQDREGPNEEAFARYDKDLMEFYAPDDIAERQAQWEEEQSEEKSLAAHRREEREKSIANEFKRLEITMKLGERKILLPIKKVGRNEPCPCGSGKKFKKCCHQLVQSIPTKQVLGGGNHYAAGEYLQKATPSDPFLVLENLTVLALKAERDGDITEAMEIFRKLEPLAERSEMLGNLLHEWKTVCYDHPELGDEGLVVMRKHQSFYQNKDREKWAYAVMDIADYLDLLERWEDWRKEYEKLLIEMPDFLFIYIRFARFLQKGDRFDEAVHHYKNVLQKYVQTKKEYLEMAAKELKELASTHKIELDSWTQKVFEDLLSSKGKKD
jgi:tetratricopeptide (TPR) repeat protein